MSNQTWCDAWQDSILETVSISATLRVEQQHTKNDNDNLKGFI